MDLKKSLGLDYRRLEAEGKRVQTIEDEFNAEIAEGMRRTLDLVIETGTPNFDIPWLKEVLQRHALVTMITAYKYAETEKQYRGKPSTKRFALPRPKLPRNLKDLMKLWDSYKKKDKVLKRADKLYESVRKQYLKKIQNIWKVYGKDFLEGKTASKEEAVNAILKQSDATVNRAKTIIATETTYYQNKARITFYDQTPEVTHYLFLAIRDKRTTPWCTSGKTNGKRGRHGLVYEKNSELMKKETPPTHFNCRSELTPLVPQNPNHKKLIEDESLRRDHHECYPLLPNWNSR